jgi:hypothetical protein
MRYALLMTTIVCVACVAINSLIGRLNLEEADEVAIMQPPATQAEMDALRAARLRTQPAREIVAWAPVDDAPAPRVVAAAAAF